MCHWPGDLVRVGQRYTGRAYTLGICSEDVL